MFDGFPSSDWSRLASAITFVKMTAAQRKLDMTKLEAHKADMEMVRYQMTRKTPGKESVESTERIMHFNYGRCAVQ